MRMWDLVSTFGFMAALLLCVEAFGWLVDFLDDPEQALERLGSFVAAFRRGLAGKATGRVEKPISPTGADSRQSE